MTSGVPPMVNMVTPRFTQGSVNPSTAFSAVTSSTNSPQWYFDSGASSHVTNDLANLQLHQLCVSGEGVIVGNGNFVPVTYSCKGHFFLLLLPILL